MLPFFVMTNPLSGLSSSTILGLNEAEASALKHLLAWLELAIAEGREITLDDLAEEFTPAELESLEGIRKAFTRNESIAASTDA